MATSTKCDADHKAGAEEARAAEVRSGARCAGCDRVFSDKRLRTWAIVPGKVLCRACVARLDEGGGVK